MGDMEQLIRMTTDSAVPTYRRGIVRDVQRTSTNPPHLAYKLLSISCTAEGNVC